MSLSRFMLRAQQVAHRSPVDICLPLFVTFPHYSPSPYTHESLYNVMKYSPNAMSRRRMSETAAAGDNETNDEKVRPPEDELASMYIYHEVLVYKWREDGELDWEHINNIQQLEPLVLTVNRFSKLKEPCPELFVKLEPKFIQKMNELDSTYLSKLAFAYAAQEQGSDTFWNTLAKQAQSLDLQDHHKSSLRKSLSYANRPQDPALFQ